MKVPSHPHHHCPISSPLVSFVSADLPPAPLPFLSQRYEWSSFTFDPAFFPSPATYLSHLKKTYNVKISLWINSYVSQHSPLFSEGVENGYFIKRTNGDVWQWDLWQPGLAIVDFSNERACDWWVGKLEALIDMGVDSLKVSPSYLRPFHSSLRRRVETDSKRELTLLFFFSSSYLITMSACDPPDRFRRAYPAPGRRVRERRGPLQDAQLVHVEVQQARL